MNDGSSKFADPFDTESGAECIWMHAGIVGYKLCDREFDCEHCPFDLALRDRNHAWAARPLDPTSRGGTQVLLHSERSEQTPIGDCGFAASLFYHPAHLWARIEDEGQVRVGLDDFGQRIVGRVYSVSLPAPAAEARESTACWSVSHQAGVTSLLSPVSGVVRQINPKLMQQPSLINRDPYGEGWAFTIDPSNLHYSIKQLHYGARAARWLAESLDRLRVQVQGMIAGSSAAVGATLPDGGEAVKDLHRLLDASQLQNLIDSFLTHPASCQMVRDAGKGR